MATMAIESRRARLHPDRVFFPAMCLLMLVTIWLGFAKTYYAAGLVRAPLPAPIIHVHAAVFTLWLLTLVVQIALVSARKVKLHMAVGLWGFGLAGAMVVVGVLAAINALRRNMSPLGSGLSALTFFAVPIFTISLFAVMAAWSYSQRRRPDYHKRLMLIANIGLMVPAIGRFPYTLMPMGPMAQHLILFSFLAIAVIYDLVTLHKVHRATWQGSLLTVVVTLATIPVGMTPVWQHFAQWVHG
ncbi:MAG TPA: hypothetical protein VG893_06565 [Terracidiphilus sp.]|nr:hypothetical protein [Terracidiphilus sp.]